MTLLWRSALLISITELLLLLKFDNSSLSVTRDRDLSHDYELMTSLPPEEEQPMEPFQWCLPTVQIWRFSLFVTGDTQIFKLVILLTLSSSKSMFILLTLGKSNLTLLAPFLLLWRGHSNFTELDNSSRTTHRNCHFLFVTSYFQWFNQRESRTGFSVYK